MNIRKLKKIFDFKIKERKQKEALEYTTQFSGLKSSLALTADSSMKQKT